MYPTCHAVPFTPVAIGSDRACTSAAVCRLANPSGCGAHNTGSVPLEQSPLNHERVWLSVSLFAGPEFEELERVGMSALCGPRGKSCAVREPRALTGCWGWQSSAVAVVSAYVDFTYPCKLDQLCCLPAARAFALPVHRDLRVADEES